ncbi:MAG: hypothetical protein RLO52_42740 [Sandaracinaceae bacterium]
MSDGTDRTSPKTSSYGIVARDADMVVVLRRGPSKHAQLLRWDLSTDRVEAGQWLVGVVELGASGVSPRGELFVYAARKRGVRFTAISRPPFFTPLAYWEEQLPWTGGGFFPSDRHVVLGVTGEPHDGGLPEVLEVSELWSYFAWQGNGRSSLTLGEAVLKAPEAHHGWTRHERGRSWSKAAPRGADRLIRDGTKGRPAVYRLGSRDLGELTWADLARDGSLVFGREGRLYRWRREDSEPREVADLTGHRFEMVPPTEEARRWPRSLRG